MRTKEEIQLEVKTIRHNCSADEMSNYRAGYLQALAWVLDEDVP